MPNTGQNMSTESPSKSLNPPTPGAEFLIANQLGQLLANSSQQIRLMERQTSLLGEIRGRLDSIPGEVTAKLPKSNTLQLSFKERVYLGTAAFVAMGAIVGKVSWEQASTWLSVGLRL